MSRFLEFVVGNFQNFYRYLDEFQDFIGLGSTKMEKGLWLEEASYIVKAWFGVQLGDQ